MHLTGWTIHKDKTTGETLYHYTTANEPGGRLRLACGTPPAPRACAALTVRGRHLSPHPRGPRW
ncbi:hypothetical protein [Streptomyces sp. DHE17-7]|uniref:hypothetical protein n=1 Tax=Streptomyces sp. DHE17-7 TaxID=2759949 RepID=UPI003FA68668